MTTSNPRLVVFNSLMLRGLIINDMEFYADEIEAFTSAFRGRRFRVLVTEGILNEYQAESRNTPQFQLQSTLANLLRGRRSIYFEESKLASVSPDPHDLPSSHRRFIIDAIRANASYLVTNRKRWLRISEQIESKYGLRIVAPGRFIELES